MNLRLKLFLLIASDLIFISSANNDGNEKDNNIHTTAAADGYHPQGSPAEVNDTRILAKSSKKKKKHKSSKKRGKNHKAMKQNRSDGSDNGDGDVGGLFGSVTTSCSATVGQSKVGFNASKQFMKTEPSWKTLAKQYSNCSASTTGTSTLTSLKFFDIPGWPSVDPEISMSDMYYMLSANPNIDTVIVAVPQNKLGVTAFTSTEAAEVVANVNTLRSNYTSIKFILAVGNEPLGNALKDVHDAMVLLQNEMGTATIPMSTPLSAKVLQDGTTWPPENAKFKDTNIMKQILDIVHQSKGPFMVNRYPYFDGLPQSKLDCALGKSCPANPTYASQFEIDILASRFAVENLYGVGAAEYIYFSNKDNFFVTETGWPSCGTSGSMSGSNTNLITYNKNAIRDVETGALKDVVGKVFLFEAHDEKNKTDEQCGGCQKCFGLMDESGNPKT